MKDEIVKEYTITIERIRSRKKIKVGVEYTDKYFRAEIKNPPHTTWLPAVYIKDRGYGKALKKVLKQVTKEIT